jgi:hypothetical protein
MFARLIRPTFYPSYSLNTSPKTQYSMKSSVNKGVRESRVLLRVATVITIVTIIAFICASYSKDLAIQKMNEIGDAVAGFASFLAFLWLIVTVVLQYTELKLQRQEISDLRAASEDQANTLRMTNRVHTLALIRSRQEDANTFLRDGVNANAQIIVNYLEQHLGFQYSDEFLSNPIAGLSHIVEYFILTDNVDNQSSLKHLIDNGKLRHNFDFQSYVKLIDIQRNMENMWKVIKPIWLLSEQTETRAEYIAWETTIGMEWYKDYYPLLKSLTQGLRAIIARGGLGTGFHQLIARDWLKFEEEQAIDFEKIAFVYNK